VVELGADLVGAARDGLLDGADQLVVVDSLAADPARWAVGLDWLSAQGHHGLLRDAVIVLVATAATVDADPPPAAAAAPSAGESGSSGIGVQVSA
jgi:hypothetical protein